MSVKRKSSTEIEIKKEGANGLKYTLVDFTRDCVRMTWLSVI